MSRSVAGFSILIYVCVVSGQQQYPRIRLKGTGDEPSIAIGVISGGNYPEGSFSIGHGDNNDNDDGGPGADYGVNRGNEQFNPDHGDNGLTDPNTALDGQGENGGIINGRNDINGHGGQNGAPAQNPGQKPPHPYDDNYNKQNTNNVPVRNSAPRHRFFSGFFNWVFSWF